jgi:chemotaxis protein methyltransferase CheR
MMDTASVELSSSLLGRFDDFLAASLGLHFSADRRLDILGGLRSAAAVDGRTDIEAWTEEFLSSRPTRTAISDLARHFTIGETYFHRDQRSIAILREELLPELIERRRHGDRRLRLWSAGCCTGEEPYTIAMLLDGLLPDLASWDITILATDINPLFLAKAEEAVYGEWSFRAMPPNLRARYFHRLPDKRMRLSEGIRRMVTFSNVNLAEDCYPSTRTGTTEMDLILCRNVLMYLTPATVEITVARFHDALVEGGWLLVAPSETSQSLFSRFDTITGPESILYRKAPAERARPAGTEPFGNVYSLPPPPKPPVPRVAAPRLAMVREPQAAQPAGERREAMARSSKAMARSFADHGELEQALSCCDQAIAFDMADPSSRYLRAIVALELGRLDVALQSLEQALYLDKDFVMALYALGKLEGRLGRKAFAARHFLSSLALLADLERDATLPESDGLTAGRLREMIRSSADLEAASA